METNGSSKPVAKKPEEDSSKNNKDEEKAAPPKLPYPKSVFFIVSNEFCERFSFYGMRAILVLYLRFVLLYSDSVATQIFHIFAFGSYFTPVLGAIIADTFLGKFWTILIISCVYAAGNFLLAFASINGVLWSSFLGLALIALGTGGIKPCVAAFGGDQFLPGQERQLAQFFSLFYIAINCGSLVSTMLTPILRQDVHCYDRPDCYPLAFGVPALLMLVALILFIMGRFVTGYIIHPPAKENVFKTTVDCIGRSLYRKYTSGESRAHWLEYADDKYNRKKINEVKALMRVLFLYIPLPMFWALFDQQASRWTLQALRLNGYLTSTWTIKPDQIQVLNPLIVVVLVPVFEYGVYPIMAKFKLGKPLKRMVIGGLLAAVSFGVCGYWQIRIENYEPEPMLANHTHLALINGVNATINVKNFTLQPYEIKVLANQPWDDLDPWIDNRTNGKSLIIYYKNETDFIRFDQMPNFLIKPEKAGALMFSVFDLQNYHGEEFRATGVEDPLKPHFQLNTSEEAIGYLEPFEMEPVGTDVSITIGKTRRDAPNLGQGTVYLQLIIGNLEDDSYQSHLLNVVQENQLSVFVQIPQYIIMSCAEILFSITGLEFSYQQAPKSMKSVLQASWLLTVAFGNLIVAVIADLKIFEKQSYEFFLFGVLMFTDALIFAVMAHFYTPFVPEETEESDIGKTEFPMQPIDPTVPPPLPPSSL